MPQPIQKPVRAILGLGMTALLLLAACTSSNSSSPGEGGGQRGTTPVGAVSTDARLAATVPPQLQTKKTLVVATDATYAPNEFIENGQITGMDVDLARAILRVLGLEARVENQTFESIIPGLMSGKYNLSMSSFTDTKARERTVDFVTYFSAGTEFFVKAQGGPTIETLDDLCGYRVALQKGTTQADDATAQDEKCGKAGRPAVTVDAYPDQNAANLALASGRDDVGMADSPVAEYQVKHTNGQFKVVGKVYGTAPYGIALPKGSGLAVPIRDALLVLIRNGTYASILAKWGLARGAIEQPRINDALR